MDNKFDPMKVAGLTEEARKAVSAAFDAMAAWRSDMANSTERHGSKVFDKMSAAAKAMGWPEQLVDATQSHLQSVSKMQMQMIDQMMDAWQEQIRSPNPMGSFPSAMMSKLQSLPGFPSGAGFPTFPGMESLSGSALNPLQFWMQMGEQWQKNWAQAMTMWANAGSQQSGPGKR